MTLIPWNDEMEKAILVIAGTSITIQTDEATAFLITPLKEFYRGFLKTRGLTSIELTVSYNHLFAYHKFKTFPIDLREKQDVQTLQLLRHVERLYPFDTPLLFGFLNGILAYNPKSPKAHIHLFRSDGKNFIMGSLHKLLFLFMAIIMADQGKLMIHGAGLRIKSEGCLFLGASGAGKSTVAGYAERKDVLSDDGPVVTRNRGAFTIHASPFSQVDLFDGKARNHHRKEVQLTKLVFLRQANCLDLKRRDKRSALAELLRDHIHGFDFMGSELKTRVFWFCCDLCTSVPAFDLYFQNDDRFLSLFGSRNHLHVASSDQ